MHRLIIQQNMTKNAAEEDGPSFDDAARRQAYERMMPERNLISMSSRSILYKPEKEYQQGLYIGTRIKKGSDVRTHYFNTLEEAKQAYRQGLIDIDDPIEIRQK